MNPIALRRLINQQLVRPPQTSLPLNTATNVIAHLGAMQAQEFAMAKWAIGLRLPGLKETDVDLAFNGGQILRTHLLRPTWHFVAPQDIGWLLALTGPRVKQVNAFTDRQCGLDAALFNRANDLIAKALTGNTYLTREELATILDLHGIKASGPRLSQLVMRAELDGLICSGPRRGNQFTYALLAERAPNQRQLTRQEALAELAMRYITSRGPATIHDFSVWSGLTVKECTEGITLNGADISSEVITGQTYYIKANQPMPPAVDYTQATFLMPDYDEYGMGYKNREAIGHAELTGTLAYNRMIVVDGAIAGSWKRTLKGKEVLLELQLNRPLSDQQWERLLEATRLYGRFIEKDVAQRNGIFHNKMSFQVPLV